MSEIEAIEYEVLGEGAGDNARMGTAAVAEILKGVGAGIGQAQDNKANKAKAEEQKVAAAAAQKAQLDAQLAVMAANSEADLNGPLHQKAMIAIANASQLAIAAGMSPGLMPGGTSLAKPSDSHGNFMTKIKGGAPVYVWVIGGTVVAGGLVMLIRHMMKGKR
jgi:hypothetical protein